MIIGRNCIETASGLFIDLMNPEVDQICIEDMAWSLSRMPRYAGHTLTPLTYSVGQHSVVVTRLIQRLADPKEQGLRASFSTVTRMTVPHITPSILMHGLVHDGSEAYLLDLPTPLKQLPGMKETYGVIEERMMHAIWKSLGMKEPDELIQSTIKWADQYALTIEAYHLIKSRGVHWTRLLDLDIMALQDFEPPAPSEKVYETFMGLYRELQKSQTA